MPLFKNLSAQRQLLQAIVLLPSAAVVLAAVWVSGMSIVENVRLAHATDRIVRLVAMTHELATTDKNFALRSGEDLLSDFARGGLITGVTDGNPATLQNPWKDSMSAVVSAPSAMRIETDVPARDCRRLASFFTRNGADLGLDVMEVHQEEEQIWHQIYSRTSLTADQPVETACGQGRHVTLALVFLLR